MRALRFGLLGAAALGLLLGGCSSDPCDGQSGTCVSARVEGAVTGLDQLRVSIGQLSAQMLTPTTPSPFSLPVKVAILLPASVTSPATITIDGTSNGQGVATSGPQAVPFTAGSHASFTFTLVAGQVGDGGVGDQGVSGDGGVTDMGFVPTPGHVSASPTTLNFPSTPRGQQSAPQAVTIYNRTGMAVSTVPPDLAGTTGNGGDFMPIGISPSGCALTQSGISLPAGVDCTVQLVFAPQTSGSQTSGMGLTFSNGDVVGLTFKGTGTPVWAGEVVTNPSAANNTTLSGVWATTGYAVVVGKFSGALLDQVAYYSTSSGTWTSAPGGLGSGALTAVTGIDASHVWAGGSDGTFYAMTGSASWTSSSIPDAGVLQAIEGMYAASPSPEVWAVNGDVVAALAGGTWRVVASPLDFSGNKAFPTAVSGVGPGQIAVVGTNGYVALSSGNPVTITPYNSQSTASLRGVWDVPNSSTETIFAVGLAQTGGGPGSILRCSGAPFVCVSQTSPMNGDLYAISGRNVNGQLDIYAVGALGNQVLHSTGNGTWTAEQVPNNGAMNAVSVAPDGQVLAVGEKGEVNHLY